MNKLNAEELLKNTFDKDRESMMRALFINLFIQQNRIQTAYDNFSPEISTKQWLLLAMTSNCPAPKTLTRIGQLMGCSRQNVKQLADSLEKKGFINIIKGKRRSVCLELTEKADLYYDEICLNRKKFLEQLYKEFTDDEIALLYSFQSNIYHGIENCEKFVSARKNANVSDDESEK